MVIYWSLVYIFLKRIYSKCICFMCLFSSFEVYSQYLQFFLSFTWIFPRTMLCFPYNLCSTKTFPDLHAQTLLERIFVIANWLGADSKFMWYLFTSKISEVLVILVQFSLNDLKFPDSFWLSYVYLFRFHLIGFWCLFSYQWDLYHLSRFPKTFLP